MPFEDATQGEDPERPPPEPKGEVWVDVQKEREPQGSEQTEEAFEFARMLVRATPRLVVTPTLIALNVLVFVAMLVRGVMLQFIILGGTVFLYRILTPSDFGAYAIIRWVLQFFAYFGEVGLGGSVEV